MGLGLGEGVWLEEFVEFENETLGGNGSGWTTNDSTIHFQQDDIVFWPGVQAAFYLVYSVIFVVGILGNVLVCWVVLRSKSMQTVTNFFITNLALAAFLDRWIFGKFFCHLLPFSQGTSIYISTLTLTSIAVDRFFVIIYPFKPRMRVSTCLAIIAAIWVVALLATSPYGIFITHKLDLGIYVCVEDWPSPEFRIAFSVTTAVLQFLAPVAVISFCYVRVWVRLGERSVARATRGAKSSRKEAAERERKRRTNRMLVAMVAIFCLSWLPINLFNFLSDAVLESHGYWPYANLCFFLAHAIAMSSTCYNIFLYSWLNENFRKEFRELLPCFFDGSVSGGGGGGGGGFGGGEVGGRCGRQGGSERTWNGSGEPSGAQQTLQTQQNRHNSPQEGLGGGELPIIEEDHLVGLTQFSCLTCEGGDGGGGEGKVEGEEVTVVQESLLL